MDAKREIEALRLEVQLQRSQLASYEEDFRNERVDRTRAMDEKLRTEEEFKAYKYANTVQLTQLSKRVEEILLQLIEKNEVIQRFEVYKKEELKAIQEENERLKNENNSLIIKLHTCNKQLKSYNQEYAAAKRCSRSFEHYASSTEDVMQEAIRKLCVRLDATTIELEAAKEEIAVKVAQVKQYQKQVEAYKQQLAQITSEVRTSDCKGSCSSEPLHPKHTDLSMRGQAISVCDGENKSNPAPAACQNTASNCVPDGDDKEDDSDDDLPPPIFHKPFQPMYHPVVAHGMQKENIPLSQLEASKLPVVCSQTEHTIGNTSSSTPGLGQTVDISSTIDKDISRVVQRYVDDREFEETDSIVPLDQNLKCPLCGKVFKKGRIQKYKRHVQICGM